MKNQVDTLIIENMNLVYDVINKNFKGYCSLNSTNREELIGKGMIALIKSANRYNPDLGYKFSSYACKCIWGELMVAITKDRETVHGIKLCSLQSTIEIKGEESKPLLDTLCVDEEHYKDIETKELIEEIKNFKKIKKLKNSDFIIDSLLEEKTYTEMSKELGVTYQVVGARCNKIKKLVKEYLGEVV